MNILVIGGNRFAGKGVVEHLVTEDNNVTLLNRTGTGPSGCKYIKCDRRTDTQLIPFLSNHKYDVILDMCCYDSTDIKTLFDSGVTCNHYILMSTLLTKENTKDGESKASAEHYLGSSAMFPYTIIRSGYMLGKNNPRKRIQYYVEQMKEKNPFNVNSSGNEPLYVNDVEDVITTIINVVNLTHLGTSYRNIINIPGFNTNTIELISIVNGTILGNYTVTNKQTDTPFDIPIKHQTVSLNNNTLNNLIRKLTRHYTLIHHYEKILIC